MAGMLVTASASQIADVSGGPPSPAWAVAPFRTAVADASSILGIEDLWTSRYFEGRLGREDQPVDYLVAFPRMAATTVERRLGQALPSLTSEARERWAPVLRLFSVWRDGTSPISTRVPTVWLEVDDPHRSSAASLVPSVSVCLAGHYRHDRPLNLPGPAQDLSLAHQALDLLKPDAGSEIGRCLDESFGRLPGGARWIHLSVMLGRPVNAIKLYGAFPREDLLAFLARVGWAGDLAALMSNLERFYPADLLGDQAFVDLNLSTFRQKVTCSLGLAVAQQHLVAMRHRDPARTELLARWVDAGLCLPHQREAIKTWLREAVQDQTTDGLPPEARRFIDLKLVCGGLGDVTAKVYLGSRRP